MAKEKKTVSVAILGGGEGVVPIIKSLSSLKHFRIKGVIDNKKVAPGIAAAKELGLNTDLTLKELVGQKDIDLIIETSGSKAFVKILQKVAPASAKVIDGAALQLYLDLAEEYERLLITKEGEIDRMKSEFISTTSHELRTPLASIKEAISLVSDATTGPINEKQRKFLGIAARNIDRLAALINNLLDMSKLDAGKMKLHKTQVSILHIAEEVFATFEALSRSKGITLQMKRTEGLPLIYADKDKISQIIINLVSNAFKFTNEGHAVEIQVGYYGPDKNNIEVGVKDTGVGIGKEDISKLFQKFQQADSPLTRKAVGTGLGLIISKEIIEMHGGRIWVESEQGKGSRFAFILPVSST